MGKRGLLLVAILWVCGCSSQPTTDSEAVREAADKARYRGYYEKVQPGMSFEDLYNLTLDSRTILGSCSWSLPAV
jgi:hypothetical protein